MNRGIRHAGFTLLEVVIALVILSFLSLFTVQAIQRALNTKKKVQRDIDKTGTMRDALRVMERDINMAFNYQDVYIKLYNQAQEARKNAALAKLTTPPGSSANQLPNQMIPQPQPALSPADQEKYKLKIEKPWSQFIGDNKSLNFTSLSNIRMMENSPISSQAEIGYHLKSCRRRSTQEQSSQCLWRRVSNYVHDDITKFGEETVLLENVTEFKLRYLGPGKDGDWVDAWSSSTGGDDTTKGKFPYAVEITLEVKETTSATKDKPLRMTIVASIRNPNNPPKQDPQNANNPANPGQPISPPTR